MSDPSTIARTFTSLVAQLEDGRLDRDLSRAIEEMVEALEDVSSSTGGKAKGVLTLKIEFDYDDGLIDVGGEISTKTPKWKRGRSIFWPTPEHHLTRRNPAQPDLPFRDVNAPPTRTI